jgi:type II pantothenate kinase
MQAVFLRHEGYLGALGALMSYRDPNGENLILEESKEKVSVNKDALFI